MTDRQTITGPPCTCGSHDTYAVLVPVFAYGREGGSRDVAETGCRTCGLVETKEVA